MGEFLLATTSLANRQPVLWVLLIGERLASDHAQGVEAEFAAARNVLGDRLVATGLRDDIPQLLAAMDVFCLPSWREGMPRTIIEAMMMAKPVIATDIRGAREEVVSGKTGLLVPVRDVRKLTDAIGQFIDNPTWGRRMGLEGRQRALKLYDEKKVVALQLERIKEAAYLRGIYRSTRANIEKS